MKKLYSKSAIVICSVFVSLFSCKQTETSNTETEVSQEIISKAEITKTNTTNSIKTFDFKGFEPYLHTKSDTTYVVNFWATWCAPCVKELPYFEEYYKKTKDQPVKVLLVSLDFPKDVEKRLLPFIKKKNLQPEVVLLDDGDADTWINKIDPNWSGAIPYTLVFNKDKRGYFEQSFHSVEEIEQAIVKTLQ